MAAGIKDAGEAIDDAKVISAVGVPYVPLIKVPKGATMKVEVEQDIIKHIALCHGAGKWCVKQDMKNMFIRDCKSSGIVEKGAQVYVDFDALGKDVVIDVHAGGELIHCRVSMIETHTERWTPLDPSIPGIDIKLSALSR